MRPTESYFNLLLFDGQVAAQTNETSAIVPFDAMIYRVQWMMSGYALASVDNTYATLQTRSGLAGMFTNASTAPIDLGVISMMAGTWGNNVCFEHHVNWKVGSGSPLYMRFVTGVTAGSRYVHCLVSLIRR